MLRFSMRSMPSIVSGGMLNGGSAIIDCLNGQSVRRNAEWRQCYYRLFERAKQHHFSFADVIGSLYVETGNVEASFSSKMIATIDPEKPIWDQYVLQNLGLELKGKNPREKIGNAVEIYHQIGEWYAEYLKTDEARENIAEFDRWLPSYAWITDVKKIDYLLWSKRTAIDEGENCNWGLI